jgi:hypothetical protein
MKEFITQNWTKIKGPITSAIAGSKATAFNFYKATKPRVDSAMTSLKARASAFYEWSGQSVKTNLGTNLITTFLGGGIAYLISESKNAKDLMQSNQSCKDYQEEIIQLKKINAASEVRKMHMSQRNDSLSDKLILANERTNDCMHSRDAIQHAFEGSWFFWKKWPVGQINSTPKVQVTDINSNSVNLPK